MDRLATLSSLPPDIILETEHHLLSNNSCNHYAGLVLMLANKLRRKLRGYTSTRGFSFEDYERVINYDLRVVRRWMDYLEEYQAGASILKNRNILELGPGSDLGIGLITLAEGAASYHALDVNDLARKAPDTLYERLFELLENDPNFTGEINELKQQLKQTLAGHNGRLNYICRDDFDLSVFKGKEIDLVLSNSAFQQFDDPSATIGQLSELVRPGALFIALVDLKTHTRWINQRDPLNIYRYPNSLYKNLMFRGAQNRMRPYEFQESLQKNGWENVRIFPRIQLEEEYVDKVRPSLDSRFQSPQNEMEILTCLICAVKGRKD